MLSSGATHKRKFWLNQSFWLVLLLWLSVMATSLGVVYVTYENRVKFNELESLRREQSQLQVTWGRYLLEESTWAAYGRVEKIAQEKLSMQVPDSRRIIKLVPDDPSRKSLLSQ